jgi:hypothetical protein
MKYIKIVLVLSGLMLMLAGCSSANESKKEVQAIMDMMAQSASNFATYSSAQRIAKPAAMVNPADKTGPAQASNCYPFNRPFFNEPVPGYGGSAIMQGNMKMTVCDNGSVIGDFMVTTTFDHATWSTGFVVSGGLTETGNITGNVYSEIIMIWNVNSSFDYAVNGHSHSVNVQISISVTPSGASGTCWGNIDSEYVNFSL